MEKRGDVIRNRLKLNGMTYDVMGCQEKWKNHIVRMSARAKVV
jgi:hypothetical protein